MTVSTIGATGDYSTINAWEAAAPAGTLTAPWEGQCQNQEFFGGDGSGAGIVIGGNTTSATNCKILTTVAGASFVDNANKLTNALRYNAANGAAIYLTAGFTTLLAIAEPYTRIEKLQLGALTNNPTACIGMNYVDNGIIIIRECVLQYENNVCAVSSAGSQFKCINCAIMLRGWNNATPYIASFNWSGGAGFYNCTCVAASDSNNSGNAFYNAGGGTDPIVKNCAIFGFGGASSGSFSAASGYNCTDKASAPGSNNQVNKTFANQFENTTSAALDCRAKAGNDLAHGTPDTGNTNDIDIVGQNRDDTTPYIGAWEIVASGRLASLTATLAALTVSADASVTGAAEATASLSTTFGALALASDVDALIAAAATPALGALTDAGAAQALIGATASPVLGSLAIDSAVGAQILIDASFALAAVTSSAAAKAFALAQYRPASDLAAGGWTPSTGTDLYAVIDEAAPDSADFDQSPLDPSAAAMRVGFAGVAQPVNDSNARVSYQIRADGDVQTVVNLRQTSGIVATWTHATTPATWQRYDQYLTDAQIASITDYPSLAFEIIAG